MARLVGLFIVGTVLNYPWELAQSGLFAGAYAWGSRWGHCLIASLGDAALIVVIHGIGWTFTRRFDWFERPGAARYVLMLTAGGVIAVGVEWIALHIAHRWAYNDVMPLIPGLNIGVVPVLQMLLLPPVIFYLVSCWTDRRDSG